MSANIPQFIDDEYGVMAPSAPPFPNLDQRRAEQRRKMFAPSFDLYLLTVVGALCAFGLLMVYSASIDASFLATENSATTYFFWRQLRNFAIGLVLMYILARLDYRVWRRLSVPMMLGIMLTLVMVIMFGDSRLEATRSLFRGSLQPGEAAKLVVVIYMAAWLSSKRHKLSRLTYGLIPFTIMLGAVTFLIVLQPDLSTAGSIMMTALTMFFLAGASWAQISFLAAGGAFAVWTISTQLPYAETRIQGHLAAIRDLSQANDHVQAAIVAFLNGGLFGVGLGEGRQKFGALPFPHTDSVFAVIGEELGLFGCFVIIALYVMMVYRGFLVAQNARDSFGALLAAGITCWLVYDALLNIAVMTAVIPPTGVPLPFISFGGSSLVAAMSGIGIVLSVSRVSAKPLPPERKQLRELEENPPKEVKATLSKKEEKALKRELSETEKAVREGLEARRRMRREVTEEVRHQREQRPTAPIPTQGLPDINEIVETPLMPASPVAPTVPDVTPKDENDHDDDPNSHLGGGNRGGRISRISSR